MLVGVDIGTQSLKAVVTDEALRRYGEASRSYAPQFTGPDRVEQSPRLWEDAIGPVIAEALAQAGVQSRRVTGLGLCGQLDGCVPVDGNCEPLGNCMIWMDRRAHGELADLSADRIHARTGIVPDPSHLAAKIRWFKRHGDEAADHFHQPVSYMVERLTGARVIDHALASTSMVYALESRRYDPELLADFDIAERELPPVRESHDRAGPLNRRGAALTGLPEGISVAVGTGDDFANPLGAGIHDVDQLSVSIGTGEVVGSIFARPDIDAARLVETHAYPSGGYFIENPGWLSGGSVKWLMDVLGVPDFAAFDALAGAAPAGCDGLIFLPALTGAMAPEWNANARGCFYGLAPVHGRAHLARAVLEGCAFAMRDVIARLAALGARPSSISMMGGGSRSRLWAQIRADVTALPADLSASPHTSVLGAAMLGGVASGAFRDLAEAMDGLPPSSARLDPDASASSALEDAYGRYRTLFSALKPVFEKN
jgi:xylulokinase